MRNLTRREIFKTIGLGAVATAIGIPAFAQETPKAADVATFNIPIGTIHMWAGDKIPEGWLECKGQYVSLIEYNELWQLIGNTYGPSRAGRYMALPDLRGRFQYEYTTSYYHTVNDPGHSHDIPENNQSAIYNSIVYIIKAK
jgi:hypothetical protein